MRTRHKSGLAWRQVAYELLEQGSIGDRAAALVSTFIIGVITVSLIAGARPAVADRIIAAYRA